MLNVEPKTELFVGRHTEHLLYTQASTAPRGLGHRLHCIGDIIVLKERQIIMRIKTYPDDLV